jgi:hypothetical protein
MNRAVRTRISATRLFFAVVALAALAAAARADDCAHFDDWRQALIAGDAAQADKILAATQKACGCVSEKDNCLSFPGYPQLIPPELWRETGRRLTDWRTETLAKCAPLPESTPAELEAKRQCFASRAKAFAEGLGGENFGRTLAPIPWAMVDANLKQLGPAPMAPAADKKAKVFTAEATTIGKQICDLSRELEDAADKLERVKRRGMEVGNTKQRRVDELETEIHDLTDLIVGQKRKFRELTGDSWNPFDFCGAPSSPEKK